MTKEEWVAKLEYTAKTSKDLVGDCLIMLDEFIEGAFFSYYHPSFIGNPFGPEILAEIEEANRRKRIKDMERYLRRKKYIKISQEGDQIISRLTKMGEIRSLKTRINQQDKNLPEGEYCIVTFDIPEDTRITRKYIRRMLKDFGFEQHQLSVWICSKDIAQEIEELIKHIKAHHWITVFRGRLISS